MKTFKKVITLLLVVALTAAVSIGGTVAYLSDSDAQVNTFTNGNVYIDLWEDFGDNDGIEHLVPAVGSAQDGTLQNGIEKEVYVTNTGSEAAYVRVHIAIPTILDNGDPTFDASQNVLHFNYNPESIGEGKWDWSNAAGAPYEGEWNASQLTIDGVDYNVYTVTYEKALASGESTVDAMHQVYLDSAVTNADIERINAAIGNEWKIYVCAEATQAAGFANAYEALNAAFGPVAAEESWLEVTGATFVESNTVFPTYESGEIAPMDDTYNYVYVAELGNSVIFDDASISSSEHMGGIAVTNGTSVTFNSGSVVVNSNYSNGARYNFYATGEGTEITINGGDFSFSKTLNQKRAYVYADAGTTVYITGGNFGPASSRSGYTAGILGSGTVVITGGTFGFNPSNWVADGYEAVKDGSTWTVSPIA